MTMIVGIATEVGIFYFSEYRELSRVEEDVESADAGDQREQRRQKLNRRVDRLIAAGKNRLRAITMTTLAAILALLVKPTVKLRLGAERLALPCLAVLAVGNLVCPCCAAHQKYRAA